MEIVKRTWPGKRGEASSSVKYLLLLDGGGTAVEAAYLDEGEGKGICCSARAGCPAGCRHCATTYAPSPFIRDLSSREIISLVRLILDDARGGGPVDFLDFSGIGDCSANWDAVREACRELRESSLIGRYTLSSIAPRSWCETLAREMRAGLCDPERVLISLHGADRETRRLLIPGAEDPREAAAWWAPLHRDGCRVVMNYVLHSGNSSGKHLEGLAEFVSRGAGWIDEVRVSALNPVPGMSLAPGPGVGPFTSFLRETLPRSIRVHHFVPLGGDRGMACGQMRAGYYRRRGE